MIRLAARGRVVLALFALSCSGKDDTDGTHDDSGADDSGGTTTPVSPDAPSVTGLSYANCQVGTDDQDIWIIQLNATDPQGVDTIDGGEADVLDGGEVVNPEPISVVCNEGLCSMSWEATPGAAGEVDCSYAGVGTLRVILTDDDGNRSAPFEAPL